MNAADPASFLRNSLRGNAAFSTVSGLAFTLGSGPVAAYLGEPPPALVLAVGLQLLFFAGALAWLAARPTISVPLALSVIVADLVWVVGTIAVVYAGFFTPGGAALALGLAAVVLLLAVLQSMGVHRMGATPSPAGATASTTDQP